MNLKEEVEQQKKENPAASTLRGDDVGKEVSKTPPGLLRDARDGTEAHPPNALRGTGGHCQNSDADTQVQPPKRQSDQTSDSAMAEEQNTEH